MKMRFLAAALLACAAQAQANDEISYSYIEADALYIFPDGSIDNELGIGLQGSVGIGSTLYLFGEYSYFEPDNIDIENLTLGAGAHFSVTDRTDFLIEAAYEDFEVDTGVASGGLDGFSLATGVRSALSNRFETGFKIGYADLEQSQEFFFARVNGLYKVNNLFGINGQVEVTDDGDVTAGLGVRLSF
ncbi:MAG: hypothetical protein Tsb002_26190 [Wenzhouxiangellaceae bacterium]